MKLFVSAIGTDSGKTLVSAVLCQTLGANYWKPVQAGLPADADWVRSMCTSPAVQVVPERYRLLHPMSPHAAAALENITLELEAFSLPDTKAHLVVEGAGGLLVPLNDNTFVVDLAQHLALPLVLVSNLYLGSINHTLLSINELKRRKVPVLGIVFNGKANQASQDVIMKHSPWPALGHLPQLESVTPGAVAALADTWRPSLLPLLQQRFQELGLA